ncbi:MAG: STAS/SEC14 domain-containing protein [Myxococcota bacterium]|nr:STAS/SEC14 domain-containing protein [Myxococcota bacterium]
MMVAVDTSEAATETCTFQRDPRGFMRAVMRTGCEMGLEDAQKNLAAIFELGGRQRGLVLVDMRGVRSQSREARQYFATSDEALQATLAVALLIGSPVSRVLANFFLRLNPQRIPTALFTAEEAAITWLMEHRP